MATLRFKNPHEAAKYVADEISRLSNESPEVSMEVAQLFLQCRSAEDVLASDWPWDGVPRGTSGASGWAELTVKARDLDVMKQIATLGGPLAAFLTTHTGGMPILLALVCALFRLHAKGFAPNPLQKRILIALRARGPMKLNDLVRAVNANAQREWLAREVQEDLASLERVRLNDGEVVALVHFADGTWGTDARGLWEVPILADFPS